MTNKDRYQRAFSALHASDAFLTEANEMKQTKKRTLPRVAAICAAVILVVGLMSGAYAADVGGVQRSIQVWLQGDLTDATLVIEDGNYTLTYEDEAGSTHEMGGGGVAYDMFGERPLTEEEILEHLDMPDVFREDDDTIWVYYHSQKIEITDQFDEDGICYVEVNDGDETIYMTIKLDGDHGVSYATNPKKYPKASGL